MAIRPLSSGTEIDAELLRKREKLVERIEAIALDHGGYRTARSDDWLSSIPVVLAPAIESQWTFDVSSSDVFGDMDKELLESGVNRSGLSPDQLGGSGLSAIGMKNLAVGSAHELNVNQMFEAGGLGVPRGTDAVRLMGRTHPGADFEFLDNSGEIIGLMNTKASSSYSIIAEHFERYPEVNYVYATHDAAIAAAQHGYTVVNGLSDAIPLTDQPIVVDVGVNSHEYRDALQELADTDDGGFFGLFDGDTILDNIPWITLGVLAFRAGKRHRDGVAFTENKKKMFRESMKSGAVYGVSGTLQTVGVPIPVTVAGSMLSAAAVQGVFRVKDEWGALAAIESNLASRVEALVD